MIDKSVISVELDIPEELEDDNVKEFIKITKQMCELYAKKNM